MKKTISNEAWAKAVSHIVTARTILSEYDNVTFMMSVANAGDEDVEIVLAMNGTTPNLFGHLVEIMNSMVDDLPKDRALKILLNMSNAVAKKTCRSVAARRNEGEIMIGSRLHIIMGNKRLKISDVIRGAKVSRPRVTGLYYGRTKGINFETLDRLCAFCSAKLATSFTSKKSIKPRQHGNADRAKGESWNRFTSILTRRE